MTRRKMWIRLAFAAAAVSTVVLCSLVAALVVVQFLSETLETKLGKGAAGVGGPPVRLAGPTVEIDFYAASGIRPQELEAYFAEVKERQGAGDVPILLTLQNRDGEFLAESSVILRWSGTPRGERGQRMRIGKSGVLEFVLDIGKAPALRIIAPAGYDRLEQFSIPLGTAYRPVTRPESPAEYEVVWDRDLSGALNHRMYRMAVERDVLAYEELRPQLRRTSHPLRLPPPPTRELTPAEVYRARRASVVILGHRLRGGGLVHATGFVLHSEGVIVTAYHAVNKPAAVARAVMTWEGEIYPIVEVLAANKSADVALVRVPASALVAAPLSAGDPPGSPVTVIGHPAGEYFTLTEGRISRYFGTFRYGHPGVVMMLTADFAEGSSGGPVLNSRGAVAGMVSSTNNVGHQMVLRYAAPAAAIRRLIRPPE